MTIHVYVNDCDEDVCLSWFLIKHHHWAGQVMNPLLNRLATLSWEVLVSEAANSRPMRSPKSSTAFEFKPTSV